MQQKIKVLKQTANQLRRDVLMMTHLACSGHPGGALSCAEIMACLYFSEMNVDPKNPKWEDRDRFVLSKGHACPALYSVLSQKGFFPIEELKKLRKLGALLQGHPDMKTPGVDITTGSLGQGVSVGIGMALGARLLKKQFRTYVLIGDGDVQEGQLWEGAMFAAHKKIDNLLVIYDFNKLTDLPVGELTAIEPVAEKFESFGWQTMEINGHDVKEILDAFEKARRIKGKPTVIIAHTTKGKGVSYMENVGKWHGSCGPNKEEYEKGTSELNEEGNLICK
jgi:transketolase